MTNRKNLSIIVLVTIAVCMGAVEVILNGRGEAVSDATNTLWAIFFLLITIFWALADAEERHFEQPFEFGFLMCIFWPVVFPYYLVATRGIEGMILFFGFVSVWAGPWLAGLIGYVYVYGG